MKTVILIHRSQGADFQDKDILSVVEEAGDSTLLVDGPIAVTGSSSSSSSSVEIVRYSPRSLLGQTSSDDKTTAPEKPEGDSHTIWVLDTRDTQWHGVLEVLNLLRFEIFYLAEPPRALVLETNSDAYLGIWEEVQDIFGLGRRRGRTLMRSARFAWLLAVLLRVFGIHGTQKSQRVAQRLRWLVKA